MDHIKEVCQCASMSLNFDEQLRWLKRGMQQMDRYERVFTIYDKVDVVYYFVTQVIGLRPESIKKILKRTSVISADQEEDEEDPFDLEQFSVSVMKSDTSLGSDSQIDGSESNKEGRDYRKSEVLLNLPDKIYKSGHEINSRSSWDGKNEEESLSFDFKVVNMAM